MTKVFVYGTLLAGEGNHQMLQGSRCLGLARTPPRFKLVDLGAFPGLLRDGRTAVVGELYEVKEDVLAALDRLEGHPRFYRREPIVLSGWLLAETYYFPEVRAIGRPLITSGDWRRQRRAGRLESLP